VVFSKLTGMFRNDDGDDGPEDAVQRFESRHIRASQTGTVLCVLVLSEHVSDREASIIFDETDALLDNKTAHLVVDLTHVEVLTSAGIGTLVRLHKHLGERGGNFAVCSLNEELRDLFRLTRMDRLFTMADDLDAAIAGVRA